MSSYAGASPAVPRRHEHLAVVISHDLDFSSLLALAGHDSPSLITLRLNSADPLFTAARLKEAVEASEPILVKGCVVTVDDQTVRVRELPIG